jgi:hypothetical protein
LPPAGGISVRALRRAALNSDGRAILHGLLLANVTRRARPPSLMLRPDGLAPARHPRFAKVPPGVPFASPARESRRALLDCHRANPPGEDVQRLRRAGDGGENSPLRGSPGEIGLRGSRGNTRAGSFRPVAAPLACPGAKLSARAGGICKDARHLAAKLRALRFAGIGVQTSGFALARLCRGNCAA